MIGFYKKKAENESVEDDEENNETNNLITKIMLLIFGFIIVFCLGFLLGKKIYQARKKRANELIDDHYYTSQDKEENIN
jgi:hypothetical protein